MVPYWKYVSWEITKPQRHFLYTLKKMPMNITIDKDTTATGLSNLPHSHQQNVLYSDAKTCTATRELLIHIVYSYTIWNEYHRMWTVYKEYNNKTSYHKTLYRTHRMYNKIYCRSKVLECQIKNVRKKKRKRIRVYSSYDCLPWTHAGI